MTLQAACSNCTVWNTETSSGSPRPACIYYNKPGHFSIAMTPLFFLFFQGVIKCDFLSVPLLKQDVSSSPSTPSNPTGSGLILYESSHDVVVFSLLLSYFPCSSQRLRCCHKAHSLLRVHGLLLIITPDSSHQNKHTDMMKSWRAAIESIGFHCCVYHKSQHLHCLAFMQKDTPEFRIFFFVEGLQAVSVYSSRL